MKIILIEEVKNLGKLGDQVSVKPGYARNFLFPKKKAILSTKDNRRKFELIQSEIRESEKKLLITLKDRASKIDSLKRLVIPCKVGINGKLFGSIGTLNIIKSLYRMGIKISRKEIILPNKLNKIGNYKIKIQFSNEIFSYLNVSLINEKNNS